MVLYLGGPLALALFLPPAAMWATLGATTILGLVLLGRTEGFEWHQLWRNPRVDWRLLLLMIVGFGGAGVAVIWWLLPHRLFVLPLERTGSWIVIMLLYPLISALPQELIFRALFFRRYGALFPRGTLIFANAAIFCLAHLMYWNAPALILTFAGGLLFGWVYHVRGSFADAVVLHAVAGQIIFTVGLGVFFYHGAV